jgi:DNA modification methylase
MIPYYDHDGIVLYHGDCLAIDAWLSASVMVSDVPYGMGYKSGRTGASVLGDETTDARDAALSLWGDRPALVFGHWRVPRPAATRMLLIWDKGDWPGMGDLSLPWGPSTEEIYVLGDGWVGRREGQVVCDPKRLHAEHPTEKPIGLMEMLLRKCPPGVIADPFAGSGATLVAARNLGRRAIGVELEERYCELIVRRLAQRTLFGATP